MPWNWAWRPCGSPAAVAAVSGEEEDPAADLRVADLQAVERQAVEDQAAEDRAVEDRAVEDQWVPATVAGL
jgi:hypothetical protein